MNEEKYKKLLVTVANSLSSISEGITRAIEYQEKGIHEEPAIPTADVLEKHKQTLKNFEEDEARLKKLKEAKVGDVVFIVPKLSTWSDGAIVTWVTHVQEGAVTIRSSDNANSYIIQYVEDGHANVYRDTNKQIRGMYFMDNWDYVRHIHSVVAPFLQDK